MTTAQTPQTPAPDTWDPDLTEHQLVCDPDEGNNVEILASELRTRAQTQAGDPAPDFADVLAAHLPCDAVHTVVTFTGAYRPVD